MTAQEILAQRLEKNEALALERRLKRHVRTFERSGLLVAMDLRRLQEGEAHIVRGFQNFGAYIESETEGEISSENAKKLSRAGSVLLLLQAQKKLPDVDTIKDAGKLPIGITGARSLATVLGQWGVEKMVEVFDKALKISDNKLVSGKSVEAAVSLMLPSGEDDELPVIDTALAVPETATDAEQATGASSRREAPEWTHNILDRMYDLEEAIRLERREEVAEIATEIQRIAQAQEEEI